MYDVSDLTSFEDVLRHYKHFYIERSVERQCYGAPCGKGSPPRPPYKGLFFVIATKLDLEAWQVSMQEGEDFSASIGAHFLQMSAKAGEGGGQDALKYIANHVILNTIRHGHVSIVESKSVPPITPAREFFSFSDLREE